VTALICLEPGCGKVVSTGSRCPTHQHELDVRRDRSRGTRSERGYDSRWARMAKEAIAEHPWCARCGTQGNATNPLTADHNVPLARGGSNVWDNVVVLCRRCNSRKGKR
jgi:5-methylcytosine-specific restriction enzyme A